MDNNFVDFYWNLLPWRQQQRLAKRQRFIKHSLFAGGLALIILICIHIILTNMIKHQENIDHRLQIAITQAKAMQNDQTPIQLLRKNNLQQSSLHLLIVLSTITPENSYLSQINFADQKLCLQGQARSLIAVNQFVKNLQQTHLVENITLLTGQTENKIYSYHFSITALCHSESDDDKNI